MGKNNRYLKIPEDLEIPGQSETLKFTDILQKAWLNDQRFAGSRENGLHGFRIQEAFESSDWEMKKPGDIVELHESDWTVLCDAIKSPQGQASVLIPEVWRRIHRAKWFDTVCDAGTEDLNHTKGLAE